MTPNTNKEQLVSALRAWAPLIASGYEVPAASMAMLQAADYIETTETAEQSWKPIATAPKDRPITVWGTSALQYHGNFDILSLFDLRRFDHCEYRTLPEPGWYVGRKRMICSHWLPTVANPTLEEFHKHKALEPAIESQQETKAAPEIDPLAFLTTALTAIDKLRKGTSHEEMKKLLGIEPEIDLAAILKRFFEK